MTCLFIYGVCDNWIEHMMIIQGVLIYKYSVCPLKAYKLSNYTDERIFIDLE